MWKIKKIMETIALFIIIMLLICFTVSGIQVLKGTILLEEIFSKTGLYFLYTIGYGALEGDAALQNILAMVGIVGLALMSTFLTINLFWRLDDVKANKKIKCDTKNLMIEFKNEGRTICDIKASFALYNILTNENIGDEKEYSIPILIKKASWHLNMDLNETFWYQTIYQLLTREDVKLYCIYSFVDTKSGQSSIKVEIFDKRNLFLESNNLTYEEFMKPVIIKKENLEPIENGGKILIDKGLLTYEFKKQKNNFVMAYYNFHQSPLNLEKYAKEKTYLEFKIKSEKEAVVTFEIKNVNGLVYTKKIKTGKSAEERINLRELNGNLKSITEICYTIFREDNDLKNKIEISDLSIIGS